MRKIPGLFQLGSNDLIKGAIHAAIISLLGGLTELLTGLSAVPMVMPTMQNVLHIVVLALLTFTGYCAKNFFTNSNDRFGRKEPVGGTIEPPLAQ